MSDDWQKKPEYKSDVQQVDKTVDTQVKPITTAQDMLANMPFFGGVRVNLLGSTNFEDHRLNDMIDLVDIPSWCDDKFTEYCDSRGTSPSSAIASAIASASAALVWSAHPNWTGNQVPRTLIDTAGRSWPKSKRGKYSGYGGIRPRRVLINKNIDPGPADVGPLAVENSDVTAATPTPSATASSGKPAKDAGSTEPTSAAAQASGSDTNTQTWVITGAVAAVLVLGGAGFTVLRARRNT